MIRFRCIPMDTASVIRFRQTGRDDAGNPLHRKIADHPSPCRHCLAESEIGAPVAARLLSLRQAARRILDAKPDIPACRTL
jgi:hypothetical protein